MGCVYLITSPSGKQYVGMTTRTLEERWREHCCDAENGSNFHFHNAIRRHGPVTFEHQVLFESDDQQELFAREIEEIAARDLADGDGYNMTYGGEGGNITEEGRVRQSATLKEYYKTNPDKVADMSRRMKAYFADPRNREIASRRNKKYCADPAVRERMSKVQKEAQRRPEVQAKQKAARAKPEFKAKMSATQKALRARPEFKAKMAAIMNTAEYKAKISAASIRNNARPEVKEKQSTSLKLTLSTPEARAKRSAEVKAVLSDPKKYNARCRQLAAARWMNHDRVMVEGIFFRFMKDVGDAMGLEAGTVQFRCKKAVSERFRFWHTIPNHNDPECDAVEECFAIMQFAEACPGHENVPDWASPHGEVPAGFWHV